MEHDLTIWYKTTTEKILAWREFRKQAVEKSSEDLISLVNNWWTYSPWVNKAIDPFKPKSWPTPWQLLEKGEFCRSAIALGQAYTLWICAPKNKTELWLVNNFSEKELHLVAVVDSKFVLNYTLGQINSIEECDMEVLEKFTKEDLNHIKL